MTDAESESGLSTSGTSHSNYPPVRDERFDIASLDGGSIIEVYRVHYLREADESGVCPFCRSEEGVEFVHEVRCESAKSRFECECGAYGENIWIWKAGTIAVPDGGVRDV